MSNKVCPVCGTVVLPPSNTCNNCGAPGIESRKKYQTKSIPTLKGQQVICPYCSETIELGQKCCPHCDAPISGQNYSPKNGLESIFLCKECNSPIMNEEGICTNCGFKNEPIPAKKLSQGNTQVDNSSTESSAYGFLALIATISSLLLWRNLILSIFIQIASFFLIYKGLKAKHKATSIISIILLVFAIINDLLIIAAVNLYNLFR